MQSKDFYQEMVKLNSGKERNRYIESKLKSGDVLAIYKIDGDLTDFSPNDYEDEHGAFMCFEDRSVLFALYSVSNNASTYLPIEAPDEEEEFDELIKLLTRLSSSFAEEVKEYHTERRFLTFDLRRLAFGLSFMTMIVAVLHLSVPSELVVGFVALLGFNFTFLFPVIESGIDHAE